MDNRRNMPQWISLYLRLIGARVRGQMQYKFSFIIDMIGNVAFSFVDFAGILIVFTLTPALGGWTLWETGLLFGLITVPFALSELVGGGFDYFPGRIREGRFDQILIRPLGAFFQVMADDFVLKRLGRLVQGGVVLGMAIVKTGLVSRPMTIVLMPPVLIGGTLFFMSLLIVRAATAIWTVESLEVFNILTNGGCEVLSHPLEIYHRWLQRFLLFVVPMAFINFVPAAAMLGKPAAGMPLWTAWLSPLIGAGVYWLSRRFWEFGVRHYQSTGS